MTETKTKKRVFIYKKGGHRVSLSLSLSLSLTRCSPSPDQPATPREEHVLQP